MHHLNCGLDAIASNAIAIAYTFQTSDRMPSSSFGQSDGNGGGDGTLSCWQFLCGILDFRILIFFFSI